MNRLKMINEERKALHEQIMMLAEGAKLDSNYVSGNIPSLIKSLYEAALIDALLFAGVLIALVNSAHCFFVLIGKLSRRKP